MVYVGETFWGLDDRFVEHKQSITNGKDYPVVGHFWEANYSADDMKVNVLLDTCSGEKKQRKLLEQRIISFLWTAYPLGILKSTLFSLHKPGFNCV